MAQRPDGEDEEQVAALAGYIADVQAAHTALYAAIARGGQVVADLTDKTRPRHLSLRDLVRVLAERHGLTVPHRTLHHWAQRYKAAANATPAEIARAWDEEQQQ